MCGREEGEKPCGKVKVERMQITLIRHNTRVVYNNTMVIHSSWENWRRAHGDSNI